ncbi:MAG TPA: hypothetical protein VFG00_01670 [Acidothermaceae bacterium]|nr:hypothetical protein [Acidothermaceae bacterium]
MGYEQGATVQLDAAAKPQVRHAVKKTVSGPTALCGAGPIETRLLGRFDGTDESACPECAQLLAAT